MKRQCILRYTIEILDDSLNNTFWITDKTDLAERELSGDEAQDRFQWRRIIRNIDPT